tara:strand:- start:195 stop:1349 length:1155 start_codon:yes stop_codon:yes gene_type:complete
MVIALLVAPALSLRVSTPRVTTRHSTRVATSTVRCAATTCPLGLELPECPVFGGRTSSLNDTATATATPFDAATALERRVQVALGTSTPLVCEALSAATDTVLRAASEELGSLSVAFNASSSLGLLARGELDSLSIRAAGLSSGGVRVSTLALDAADVRLVPLNPLEQQLLPNLARPTELQFSLRFSQDDLNRSPVVFAAIQELLREVLRSGISAAIGEVLPREYENIRFDLRRVESLQRGRVVLQADAEATGADGTRTRLEGMRVRTSIRLDRLSNMVLLDSPELISSFEGFGAKIELGLPFLRGAGIPLPEPLRLSSIVVDDGAVDVAGAVALQPINYADIAAYLDELQRAAQATTPQAVPTESNGLAVRRPPDGEYYGLSP